MSNLEIRPAPASLLPQIQTALRATWEAHRARQPFAFSTGDLETLVIPGLAQSFQDHDGQPLDESPRIFAAYLDNRYAGYIALSQLTLPDGSTPAFINIDDIHVQPDLRGQGIARALVDHAKALADTNDWDNLTATVWFGNDSSARLFASAGFAPTSTTLRYGPARQVRDQPAPPATPSPRRQGHGDVILAVVATLALVSLAVSCAGR